MRIERLPGPFGAEVTGVDARLDLDRESARQLRSAWREHALLLLRGQDLSGEEQVAFARVFGEIEYDYKTRDLGYHYVSNAVQGGYNPDGELGFHSDHTMFPRLLLGLMLHGIDVTPAGAGGDTVFADMRLVYRSLPEALRQRIGSLTVRHGMPDLSKGEAIPGMLPGGPHYDRPLALAHPVTGETLLFLSRRHVDRILELSPQASAELIDELDAYIHRPSAAYHHVWQKGDLVVFDNIALQHRRTDFDRKHKRHLRRLQIALERGVPA